MTMRRRTGTDALGKCAMPEVHSRSGLGTAEDHGAGAAFPSGGTGTSFSLGPRCRPERGVHDDVLALRCLATYLGPTVATAL